MAVNNVVTEDALGLRAAAMQRLDELEDTIYRGLMTFIEVGRALQEIAELKLYLVAGYKTFEDYTRDRLGLSRSGAFHKIDAAKVVDVLAAADMPPPSTEMQARALAPLLGRPDVLQRAWRDVGEKPQTRDIQRVVNAQLGKVDGREGMRGRERVVRCPSCGHDFPTKGHAAPRDRELKVVSGE